MARPRKSTALMQLEGSFDKHPERLAARVNEPKPVGSIGPPPADFQIPYPDLGHATAAKLLAIWNETLPKIPPGVLGGSDTHRLESYCRLKLKERQGKLLASEGNRLDRIGDQLGLSPAGRAKLVIAPTAGSAAASSTPADGQSKNQFEQIAEEVRAQTGSASRPN